MLLVWPKRPHFETFDPKSETIPEAIAGAFFATLHKARILLADRSIEGIRDGARLIDRMSRHPDLVDPDFLIPTEPPSPLPAIDGAIQYAWPANDDLTKLHLNRQRVNLREYAPKWRGHWYELFAIFALVRAERALYVESLKHDATVLKEYTIGELDEVIDELSEIATRAIEVAESMKVESTVRARAARAVNARFDPLKKVVAEMAANDYPTRSSRDAARRIFKKLLSTGELVHDKNNNVVFNGERIAINEAPEELLERWIGKQRSRERGSRGE